MTYFNGFSAEAKPIYAAQTIIQRPPMKAFTYNETYFPKEKFCTQFDGKISSQWFHCSLGNLLYSTETQIRACTTCLYFMVAKKFCYLSFTVSILLLYVIIIPFYFLL